MNPTSNLLQATIHIISNSGNQLNAIDDILQMPKDQDGNMKMGLDDRDFTLWENALKNILPTSLFGPILIPTNPLVINALLNEPKLASHFIGNRSTDIIRSMFGTENPFSANTRELHGAHKVAFKNAVSDVEKNAIEIYPIVKDWIEEMKKWPITDQEIEILTARIMASFLLDLSSVERSEVIDACILLKRKFVDTCVRPLQGFFSSNRSYNLLSSEIDRLLQIPSSYPYGLRATFSKEAIVNHVLTLISVGFDNMQSALMSFLIRLCQYPEFHPNLLAEVQTINETSIEFINFNGRPETFARRFFNETMRMTPPVWLQARKNANETLQISYGDGKSFILEASTLILIPNFNLARTENNDFDPSIYTEFQPFSVGPNACPARFKIFGLLGVFVPLFLKYRWTLKSDPTFVPEVSLKWKNIIIHPEDYAETDRTISFFDYLTCIFR